MVNPGTTSVNRGAEVSSIDPFSSATDLLAALQRREFSSRELVETYLERTSRFNPALNAIVTLEADRARSAADAADAARARGDRTGPLHGLPITVKDVFETAGMRTTSGSETLHDYVPEKDAEAVGRLRAAGAIVLGKSNVPEFAWDSQSYNTLFGTTNNPWDLKRTPGGSSGGAAAAVAAGLIALEVGSDLGGSIRIPAHFCGLYALKPTFGVIPIRGHVPPPPGTLVEMDVGVAGPIARSAQDLDLSLAVMAGPDAAAGVAWRLELPPPRSASLAGYRIAAWMEDRYSPVDADTTELMRRLIDDLRAAGASIDEEARPASLAELHDVAQRLIQGAVSMWLPDQAYQELIDRAGRVAPDDNSPPARWARNITQRTRDFKMAEERRLGLKAQWAEFFTRYDALLCPVMPTPAILHDHDPDVDARRIAFNDTTIPYGDQYTWLQAIGVVHLPAVVAPVGLTPGGLPVGVQIVAPLYEDRTAIDIARHIAQVCGGFQAPPGF